MAERFAEESGSRVTPGSSQWCLQCPFLQPASENGPEPVLPPSSSSLLRKAGWKELLAYPPYPDLSRISLRVTAEANQLHRPSGTLPLHNSQDQIWPMQEEETPLRSSAFSCPNTSQNQRTVRVGRDFEDHVAPTPLPWEGTPHTRWGLSETWYCRRI